MGVQHFSVIASFMLFYSRGGSVFFLRDRTPRAPSSNLSNNSIIKRKRGKTFPVCTLHTQPKKNRTSKKNEGRRRTNSSSSSSRIDPPLRPAPPFPTPPRFPPPPFPLSPPAVLIRTGGIGVGDLRGTGKHHVRSPLILLLALFSTLVVVVVRSSLARLSKKFQKNRGVRFKN